MVLLDKGMPGFQKHVGFVHSGEHTTDFAPSITRPSRACGAEGVRVENPADLVSGLAKAWTAAAPG